MYIHLEEVLFYLKRHFSEDKEVRNWLAEILRNQNLLFHHIVALIFKFFPDIEFMEDVCKRYFMGSDRHWLVKYFMFHWLYKNKKFELISSFQSDNYFLNREANNFKLRIYQDPINLEMFIQSLLRDRDCLVALHGLNFRFFQILTASIDFDISDCNEYIRSIVSKDMTDYIKHTLKNEFSIVNPEKFFNSQIWNEEKIYQELNISFRAFFQYKTIDASKSLLNLNLFNNLVYDKICEILKINKKASEYGVNLNSGCIEDYLPIANRYLTEINEKRNQRTEAHPYDKYGNLRIRISSPELDKLVIKHQKALEEICKFDFLSYL